MKYYLVQDSEIDETLGVEIWGEVEDAETPRPQFHITITEGKVLEEILFDYDVTTDIDGVGQCFRFQRLTGRVMRFFDPYLLEFSA